MDTLKEEEFVPNKKIPAQNEYFCIFWVITGDANKILAMLHEKISHS